MAQLQQTLKFIPFFLSLLVMPFWLRAQTVSFPAFTEVPTVCQNHTQFLMLSNPGGIINANIQVAVSLPCGLKYIPGTATGISENNISNLQNPIFEINGLGADAKLPVSMEVTTDCSALPCLDQGQIYTTLVTLTVNGVNTTFTSDIYNVETPRLVITKVIESYLQASQGQTITRLISIRNTRGGRLSSFLFSDTIPHQLVISTLDGTDAGSTPTKLLRIFGPADFQKVGNKDEFFDFNEEIIITESIYVAFCDFSAPDALTTIRTSWGCGSSICQSAEVKTIVAVKPLPEKGRIDSVFVETSSATCYDGQNFQQKWSIKNKSAYSSIENLLLRLNMETDPNIAFVPGSLSATLNGSTINILVEVSNPFTSTCGESIAPLLEITLPVIPPGQTLEIRFDQHFCAPADCILLQGGWSWKINYEKSCAAPGDQFFTTMDSIHNTTPLFNGGISFEGKSSTIIQDNEIINLNLYIPKGLFHYTGNGWTADIFIPCGLVLVDTVFPIKNVLPLEQVITNDSSGTKIHLRYPLPMPFPNDTILIPLKFELQCDKLCDSLPCLYTLETPCGETCFGVPAHIYISADVFFNIDDDCPSGFNPRLCAIKKFDINCFEGVCADTLMVYLDHTVEMSRLSLGLPDNDNDFQPDLTGSLDFSKIRLDRAMPGDTVNIAIDGVVKADNPDDQFESMWIRLKFGNRGALSPSQFIDLLANFVNIENTLTIKDHNTGLQFDVPVYIEFNPYDSLLWCRVHFDSLALKYPQVPKGFRLEDMDEVNLDIIYRLQRIFLPFPPNYDLYSVRLVAESNVYLFNGAFTPEIERRICPCPSDFIDYTCLEYDLLRSIEILPICKGNQISTIYFEYGTMHNFFPFEYRPVMDSVLTFCIEAKNFVINSAILNKVRINDVSKTIGIPVDVSEVVPGTYCLEVNPLFLSLQEEHNVFELSLDITSDICEFSDKPQVARAKINFQPYAKRTSDGEINMSVNLFYIWKRTVPGSKIQHCNQTFLSDSATWNFEITNCFPVLDHIVPMPNVWVKINASGNALKDIVLRNVNTGLEIPLTGDRYLLGDVGVCDTLDLSLTARNLSCSVEHLFLEWGWSCDSLDLDDACYTKFDTCSFISIPGDLEMFTNLDSISANLCDTMPISHSLHLNADLGTIYEFTVSVILPQGLNYLPGTSEVIWESGTGTLFPINDPEILPDGRLQWVLDSLVPGLEGGLPGTNSIPFNALELQFQTISECGFISGGQLIYTYTAKKVCDLPTNTVTKVSGPYGITGVMAPHDLDIQVGVTDTASCQQNIVLDIGVNTGVITQNNESVSVQLPPGLFYMAGSCITNLSQKEPQIVGNRLIWPLEPGINFTTLSISLLIAPDAPCEPLYILIYSTISTTSICETTGEECGIEVISGSRNIPVTIDRPTYAFTSVEAVPYLSGYGVQIMLTQNGGNLPGSGVVDLWLDLDGDGLVSPGDLFVANKSFSFSNTSGTISLLIGPLDIPIEDWCKLLVVLEKSSNCTCASLIAPLQLPIIFPAKNQIPLCWNDSIQLGSIIPPGTDVHWQGSGLSCTDCAQPWFSYTNTGNNLETFVLLSTQNLPGGCSVIHEYVVDVYPEPGLVISDAIICMGDTATLLATPANSWIWVGPAIIPGAGQVALVHPGSDAQYQVTIMDEAGCVAVDTAYVSVIQLPSVPDTFDVCLSDNLILQVPIEPGTVYYWSNAGNRLSDITTPNPTLLIKENFDFILFRNNGICVAVDTIALRILDTLEITGLPDTFRACAGDTAMFQLIGGIQYTWTPSSQVICLDSSCAVVKIPVTTQQTYIVTAIAEDGCTGSAMVTIVPEENEVIHQDTLSICPGQVVEIFGELIGQPGLYCDTIQINPGCLDITCIWLELRDSLLTNITDTLCEGESLMFFGNTLTMPGKYCQTITSPEGCDSTVCLELTFLPATIIIIPEDTLLCPGDTAWIEVVIEPLDAEFNWTDGWPDLFRPVTTGISYTLIVQNICGSVDTAVILVGALPPPIVDLGPDTLLCQDSTFFLAPNIPDGTVLWEWADGYPDLNRPITIEGLYILTVTDSCGQMVTDSILFSTGFCGPCHLDIPNLFTPNGDDVNDVFKLVKDCDILINMKIFNRWGNLVYEETSLDPIWDGISKGVPQPMEVYAYVISFTDPNQGAEMIWRGDVTLVR